MNNPLKVLHLEDNPLDADLVHWTLAAEGLPNTITRVETRDAFAAALEEEEFDLILADYTLPAFDGISALAIARERRAHIPFIILSGVMGEEVAIETLKSGATDYVLKQRMSRLVPSVRRALQQTQERLQRQLLEEKLRLLEKSVEHLNDIVMIIEVDSPEHAGPKVVFVNDACIQRTGYTPEEIIGQAPPTFEGPRTDPAALERIRTAMAGFQPVREELLNYTKDGQEFWIELDIVPVANAQGRFTHWVSIGRDITERKRAEETRLRLQEQLYHSQKMESIGLLAGGVAHDFNNLLTSILSSAELAQESLPEVHPAREDLKTIIKAALRASGLTKELLAYAGGGRRSSEVVNINHLVTDMLAILRSQMPKSIIVRKALQSGLPPVEADPVQIQQVIMNLCLNASEAMKDHGGVLSITTDRVMLNEEQTRKFRSFNPPEPGLYALFEVSDTGSGMDAETQKRIFEPFYSTKTQGRGLGLAAVLGIIKSHRGGIEVMSEPGEGTTFTVYLPATDKPFPEEMAKPAEVVHGPHTILFVDDEEILRALGQRILERLGYRVILAADGIEAVRIFQEHMEEIDLVILDLSMPRKGGEDTYHEISQIRPDIKVILCSGYDESTANEKIVGDNLVGLIQKPFEMNVFARAVHAALEQP
ncbi:MAG: response regulator [Pseudomonadota bacterium]